MSSAAILRRVALVLGHSAVILDVLHFDLRMGNVTDYAGWSDVEQRMRQLLYK